MVLFDLLYSVAIVLSLPLWLKFIFKEEYRQILKHRLAPGIEPGKKKRIWIHAVSVGEVRSVKSLIEQLIKKYDREIVLSVTTPSGFKFAEKEYKDIKIKVINAPLDFSFTIKKFLKKVNPAIMILNELEIWPNWILKTKKAQIPVLLINGRISDNAFKKYKIFKFILKRFVNKINLFLVQAEIYREKFLQLDIPAENIKVCGNIKADTAYDAAASLPANREIWAYLGIGKSHIKKKIITLASIHPGDEKIIIPIIDKILKKFSVIIVPRHLNRVEEIGKLLENKGLKFARWSSPGNFDINQEILIFDRMGYLFNIMKISDIVFMGGTFDRKIGGHNLYEPAALGKLIIGGPDYNNFPDIGRELEEKGIYKKVTGAAGLQEFLLNIEKTDFKEIKKKAAASVFSRRGSVEYVLKEIQGLLSKSGSRIE